jgi:molybdopterin converting factor small subunit
MSDEHQASAVIKWWAMIVFGALAALLIGWLGHLAGVSLGTVLSIAAVAAALAWLIILVAVPWNLYFGARRVVMEMAVSHSRGIDIPPEQDAEAHTIARRMLWFALGGHVVTAAVAGVVTYVSGATIGYYITAAYLFSATIRPAAAYFAHLRERISTLSRESLHPREDVEELRARVAGLVKTAKRLDEELAESRRALSEDMRRTEIKLADGIAHGRQVLTADLARLQDAQIADSDAARKRDDELGQRIDSMIRRIDETLTGLGDQQELLAGLRALVRMVRAEPASPS